MIKFKQIIAENFLCFPILKLDFDNVGDVDIEDHKPESGIVDRIRKYVKILVQGNVIDKTGCDSNGAGKSAIFETIFFGLYGKTIRGYSGNEVINKDSDFCKVVLTLEKDGEDYIIERIRDRKKSPVLKVDVGGVDKTHMDVRKTQVEILDKIIPFGVLKNTLIFSGSLFESFVNSTDVKKKEIISDIIGLDELDEIQSRIKFYLKKVCGLLETTYDSLNVSKGVEDILKEEIEKLNGEYSEMDVNKEIDEFVDSKSRKVIELGKIKKNIEELNKEKKIEEDKKQLNEKEISKFNDLKIEKSIQINEIQKKIDNVEKRLSGKVDCPLCGGKLSKGQVDEFLKKDKEEISISKRSHEKYEKKYFSYKEIDKGFNIKIDDTIKDINKNNIQMNELDSELKLIDKSVDVLKTKEGFYKDNLKTKQLRMGEEATKIKMLMKREKLLEGEKEKAEFWIEGFGTRGIKNFVLEMSIPELNSYLNRYLSYFFNGSVMMEFHSTSKLKTGKTREKWGFETKGVVDYTGCSSGQRRRIDLAVLFSLNKLMRRKYGDVNLLICDELFDPLDDTGVESIFNVLIDMDIENVFVITHSSDILRRYDFSTIWTVEMKNGQSNLSNSRR